MQRLGAARTRAGPAGSRERRSDRGRASWRDGAAARGQAGPGRTRRRLWLCFLVVWSGRAMGKQDKAAKESIYKDALAPTTRKLLEACTADGEDKPADGTLRELFDVMRAANAEECTAIGEWFDQRLGHSSVDVKVKAVLLMHDAAVRLGHRPLHAALQKTCVKTLEQLTTYKGKPHPTHGELPNKMVRNRSAKLITSLKETGSSGVGIGGLLLAVLCIVFAVVAALHHNHGSPRLLWYRTQRHADLFMQSASDTLFGPPPPHNDTVERNDRFDPVEPFVPGKESLSDTPAPPTPQPLSSEDTFTAIQAAFKFFDVSPPLWPSAL